MPSPIQRNFSAGEQSPAMYANADMVRYQTGLKTLRNAIVLRTGGVQNRPGTEYLGTTKGNGAARLIPAVFDTTESYVLEFGNLYMRVWEDGALVTVGTPAAWLTATPYVVGNIRVEAGTNYHCLVAHTSGTFATDLAAGKWYALTDDIFEIPTPYTAAQLFDVQYAAQYRVLTLVHPSHPPAQLTKGATDILWTLADIDFTAAGGIGAPQNVAVDQTPAAPDGIGYVVTGVAADGTESVASAFAQSDVVGGSGAFAAETALGTTPVTVSWNTLAGAASYNIYRKPSDSSNYGFLLNTPSTSYTDNGFLTIVSYDIVTPGTVPLTSDIFGTSGNYPSVVGAYQQRLILAGTDNQPDYVYASQVAAPENFNVSDPIVDSDAMEWRQVGRRLNRIQHFAEIAQRLVQFSDVGESIIQGDTDGILRPGEVNPRQFSENGAANLPPLVVNDSALYVQARGAIVRDIAPIQANGFTGSDLTLQSAHLVDGFTLADWCYQQTPNSVVWAVRDDGTLLSLTYVRELGILGWGTHDTDGIFESIACIPEGTQDAVYAVVSRTIDGVTVRYVERMTNRLADTPVLMDSVATVAVPIIVSSVTPSSFAPNEATAITISGANFRTGTTVAISGTGMALSGVVIVDTETITATMTVDSGAALGNRTITVTRLTSSDTATVAVAYEPLVLVSTGLGKGRSDPVVSGVTSAFVDTEFTPTTGTLTTSFGGLRWDRDAVTGAVNVYESVESVTADCFIQAVFSDADSGTETCGVGARMNTGAPSSVTGVVQRGGPPTAPTFGLIEYSNNVVLQSSLTTETAWTLPARNMMYVSGTTAKGYDFQSTDEYTLTGLTLTTGRRGLFFDGGGSSAYRVASAYYRMSSHILTVNGPTNNIWKVSVRNGSNVEIATATAVSGVASVDLFAARVAFPDAVSVHILAVSDDSPLVTALSPAGRVWGGDVYEWGIA